MNYLLTIFLLIFSTNQLISYVNNKRIDKNKNFIHHSKFHVKKIVKKMNTHISDIKKVHNLLKRRGIHIKHKAYNKLVVKYGKLVKNYNKTRKSFCAKLPPLWTLYNKDVLDLTPKQLYCSKWYYYGEKVGHKLGFDFFHLGYKGYYTEFITMEMVGIREILHKFITKNELIHVGRNCYYVGLLEQLRRSIKGYKTNDKSLFKLTVDYKNYRERKIKLLKVMKTMTTKRKLININ